MALTKVSYSMINGAPVNVLDFGAVGDGVTDDAVAIQAAYAAVAIVGGTLFLPSGNYYIGTTTLVFDQPNVLIQGEGLPNRQQTSAYVPRSTTITYSGTGTAIQLGKWLPTTSGNPFTFGIAMENIQVNVAPTTNFAIDIRAVGYGHLKYVTVFGNSGSGNVGIRAAGLIIFTFEKVEVSGQYGASGVPANYLGKGFVIGQSIFSDTSGASQASSAVDFYRCYFHYCYTGFYSTAVLTTTIYDCDFEACTQGANIGPQSALNFITPHFEANSDCDIYFAAPSANNQNQIYVQNASFNAYNRAMFFGGGGFGGTAGPLLLKLKDCQFGTSATNPYLFTQNTGFDSTSSIKLENCLFTGANMATNLAMTNGSAAGGAAWFNFVDMPVTVYRFYLSSVTVGLSATAMTFVPGDASATMYNNGFIVGTNTYYTSAVTTPDYTVNVLYNGISISALASASATAQPVLSSPITNKVSTGGKITATVATGASFAPTGGTLIMEVLVATGKSGI